MSNVLLYLITVLVWGSTWIAIEHQLGDVAPEVSVFYRYVVASAMLFAWCFARGLQLRFGRRDHLRFILLGLLLFSLNYVLTYHAQQHITSALTAIAFSTMLWMNILNSRIFLGSRASRSVIGGSILGVVGIGILLLPEVENLSFGDATLYGTGLAVIGAFVASLGNIVSQAAQKNGLPIVQSNAWGMFYGAVLTGTAVLIQGHAFSFDWSMSYVLSLVYLAIFGSIVGFGSYLKLLGRIGASKAGYAMVMFPVVAIVISVIVGEISLDMSIVIGVGVVLTGNILVLRSGRGKVEQDRISSVSGSIGRYALQKRR